MPKITPFLWFDRQAEEAAKYYVSVFKRDSRVKTVTRYGEGARLPKGTVLTVAFQLNGQDFVALNGGPQFQFTEAVSFVVNCRTQREIDYYWKRLSAGGREIECGWLKDKYGLCWQIVPDSLHDLLDARHPDRSERVFQAILGMTKLDIAELKRAYSGKTAKAGKRPKPLVRK